MNIRLWHLITLLMMTQIAKSSWEERRPGTFRRRLSLAKQRRSAYPQRGAGLLDMAKGALKKIGSVLGIAKSNKEDKLVKRKARFLEQYERYSGKIKTISDDVNHLLVDIQGSTKDITEQVAQLCTAINEPLALILTRALSAVYSIRPEETEIMKKLGDF